MLGCSQRQRPSSETLEHLSSSFQYYDNRSLGRQVLRFGPPCPAKARYGVGGRVPALGLLGGGDTQAGGVSEEVLGSCEAHSVASLLFLEKLLILLVVLILCVREDQRTTSWSGFGSSNRHSWILLGSRLRLFGLYSEHLCGVTF